MDAVIRGAVIYVFLLVVFRIAGRRTLAEMTSFDFVLLLIIGEATQQALLGDDFSITNALIVIMTLVGADIALSIIKEKFPRFARIADGVPMVVVADGEMLRDRAHMARIDESDILQSARKSCGLERLEQIRLAVLEIDGTISIIPRTEPKEPATP